MARHLGISARELRYRRALIGYVCWPPRRVRASDDCLLCASGPNGAAVKRSISDRLVKCKKAERSGKKKRNVAERSPWPPTTVRKVAL
ncbi:MAG TPA: hypothetical protein PKZ08_00525 [Vicinamibacterales bacterium]|nr:hypothetical protein [Vicinamibacterales bacterium]